MAHSTRQVESAMYWARLAVALGLAVSCQMSASVAGPPHDAATQSVDRPLFQLQYSRFDPSFCHASACVDFENDASRELVFASRKTGRLELLEAATGKVKWSRALEGKQQSISAF